MLQDSFQAHLAETLQLLPGIALRRMVGLFPRRHRLRADRILLWRDPLWDGHFCNWRGGALVHNIGLLRQPAANLDLVAVGIRLDALVPRRRRELKR